MKAATLDGGEIVGRMIGEGRRAADEAKMRVAHVESD